MKINFTVFSESVNARQSFDKMVKLYGQCAFENADYFVVLGGDGSVLRAIHSIGVQNQIPIFSINRGNYGFLTNPYSEENLEERLLNACEVDLSPLFMSALDKNGKSHSSFAINEVYATRSSHQAAKIKISIDGVVRIQELVGDGVIVSTATGSTAYNYSAHGPIFPLDVGIVAVTPISAFRPRRWRGALIKSSSMVSLDILDSSHRPVLLTADFIDFRDIVHVDLFSDPSKKVKLLFDKDCLLDEKMLQEQFEG